MNLEIDKKHIVRRVWVNACRFLLGGVFIFSGFVKAIDPFGTFYKLQDYVAAFGMDSWLPSSLLFVGALLLAALEFCLGVYLFLGIRRGWSAWVALLLMAVMTPLTLYLAIANPVPDCGCFGDAWVLTNWETFGKNVILFVAAFSVFRWRKDVIRFITRKIEWVFSMYTILFVFALSIYCQHNLPIIDFRPYKIGVNIPQALGSSEVTFETRFLLEKDGVRKEFTSDNYPDSTWTLVETRTITKEVEKDNESPLKGFFIQDLETDEDLTEKLLSAKGYTFLLVAHRIEYADDSHIDLINEIYDYSVEHGYGFYALTASPKEEILQWSDRTGAEYPFYEADELTLKTMIRSNPGMFLLKDGTILHKWSDGNLPDEYALYDALEKIPLGQEEFVSLWHTMGKVLLWFIVPLCLVLAVDILFIKRREKRIGHVKTAGGLMEGK